MDRGDPLTVATCPLLRLHHIGQNVVNQRQVTPALRFQPVQHALIQTHADRFFPRPDIAQPHHRGQLPVSKARDHFEVDPRVVPRGLSYGNASNGLALAISQFSVSDSFDIFDMFGAHAFQPRGLK